MTLDDAKAALPRWTVLETAPTALRNYRALEPNYQVTGIAVEADDLVELVERARAWVGVVELAAGRVRGSRTPTRGDLHALPRVSPTDLGAPAPTPHAREVATARGYTGDVCGTCGSLAMRRNGVCLVCDACGTTTGCS